MTALVREILQGLIGQGFTEQDFATLLVQQAKAAGLPLEPENVTVGDGLS